jgi:hypothetical protein
VTTPIVAAITNERGAARSEPVRRDTSRKGQAIVGVVADRKITVRMPAEKLLVLAD